MRGSRGWRGEPGSAWGCVASRGQCGQLGVLWGWRGERGTARGHGAPHHHISRRLQSSCRPPCWELLEEPGRQFLRGAEGPRHHPLSPERSKFLWKLGQQDYF